MVRMKGEANTAPKSRESFSHQAATPLASASAWRLMLEDDLNPFHGFSDEQYLEARQTMVYAILVSIFFFLATTNVAGPTGGSECSRGACNSYNV